MLPDYHLNLTIQFQKKALCRKGSQRAITTMGTEATKPTQAELKAKVDEIKKGADASEKGLYLPLHDNARGRCD